MSKQKHRNGRTNHAIKKLAHGNFRCSLICVCPDYVALNRNRCIMSELEKTLANALNRLIFSSNHYIDDGSWIDVLDDDIKHAQEVIKLYKQTKKERVLA